MNHNYFRVGILAAAFLSAATTHAQNVGIGTTTPRSKLSVNGTTASGGIAVGDATYTSTLGTVAPANGAIIQGNTGIGITTPAAKLHVVDGDIFRSDTDGNAYTHITSDGAARIYRNGPAKGVPFVNGYVDLMNDTTAGASFGRLFYYKGVAGQAPPLDTGEGLAFSGGPGTFPQVVIQSGTGFMGIGTTVPQAQLHATSQIYATSAGTVTGNFWQGTANKNGGQLHSDGFIGLQRAVNASLLLAKPASAVAGESFAAFSINGFTVANITYTGGGVAYNTTSDERLKEHIRPSAKGLADVMKVQVSDFNYKSNPGHDQTGFIAQQLHTVFPDAVTVGGENATKNPWTVDYGRVTPVLVKAIQEQQTEIEALKAENAQLKAANSELAAMSSDVEALKKAVAAIQSNGSGNATRTVVSLTK